MPSKKPAAKGGKKAAKSAPKASKAKKSPAKKAAKPAARKESKDAAPKVKPTPAPAPAPVTSADAVAPRPEAPKKKVERKPVVPWKDRFKTDTPGPWTCPKCGALPQRAQPLYGEDERHHCPNVECDAVVTLLSKEDLEPAEKRGSWPPQRNKNRALPGGMPGIPGVGGPPGGLPPPGVGAPPPAH